MKTERPSVMNSRLFHVGSLSFNLTINYKIIYQLGKISADQSTYSSN